MTDRLSKLQNALLGELLFGRLSFIPMERHEELLERFLEENPPNGHSIKEQVENGIEWINRHIRGE